MSAEAPPATIGAMLAWAAARLEATVEQPAREAEWLLANALGVDRARLLTHPERPLDASARAEFTHLVERRASGEPAAYVLGRREFWSLELEVTPDVLVPRPETELLVEFALERLRGHVAPRVLDLGTGSGALALAIASERPDAAVVAVDASAAALAVAERNRARLGLTNVALRAGDWWTPVAGERFDLVAANPPYLAADDPHLPALAHEPRAALVAGPSGLEQLERIATGAPAHLAPDAWLAVEHGATQAAAVRAAFTRAGLLDVGTRRDLAGLERLTAGRRAG